MSREIGRRPFTGAEFERLVEVGIIAEDDRVELLDGDIITRSPIGRRHAACVKRLNALLGKFFAGSAVVSVQDPVRLNDFSDPQPDVALLSPRDDFYESGLPRPRDILLIVEVADTSIDVDLGTMIPMYARAGIPEAWLVDLNSGTITIFSEPKRGRSAKQAAFQGSARLASPVLARRRVLASQITP